MNEDSLLEVSNDQIAGYQHQIKLREEVINQVQDRNRQLTNKIEDILNQKSIIEQKFESIQSQQQKKTEESSTTLVLSQKIEYLQSEIESISEIKHKKEVECRNLEEQIRDKDNLIISK